MLESTRNAAPITTSQPTADTRVGTPFHARRERFVANIGRGVAIIPAAGERFKSRDTEARFRQDSEFFYLTGFVEPDAVAVLTPHDPEQRFTLFVRPRDPERETWNGPRAGVEGARTIHGADAAYPISEMEERLAALIEPADAIWYTLGANEAMNRRVLALLQRFRPTRPRTGKGPRDVRDPAAILDTMRLIKEPLEIERLRAAADLSIQGHHVAARTVGPGVGEWEVEAALEHTYRRAGGWGASFQSIVGGGRNATVLHYVVNDRRMEAGELVLVDSGAELGMYCGDITRVYPVSGRFTVPQRQVYDLVLRAERAAIDVVRPGARFSEMHDAAVRVLAEGLVDLGALSGEADQLILDEAYKRFYMHQTSHWLGLDVHDAGPYRDADGEWLPLVPGMVLTVEPGLYFPNDDDVPAELRGIGVRIEDDVLVTEAGHEVLTAGLPADADAIEAMMRSA